MITFEERHGSVYAVEGGEILYEVEEAAVFIDKVSGTVLSIGNKDFVKERFEKDCEKAKGTFLVDDWVLLDLPKDAELLTMGLNNVGYLFSYLKKEGIL